MEREQLLKMVQIYKTKLADATEQNIIYQVVISAQVAEKDALEQTINNLEAQLAEFQQPVQTCQNEEVNE